MANNRITPQGASNSVFLRPVPHYSNVASFAGEANRLERFRPPFRFTSFFSPEDTLLCVLAAERALGQDLGGNCRIVELTAGSGLVGFRLLDLSGGAELSGFDVDPTAAACARANAELLGHSSRSRFAQMSLWDDRMEAMLSAEKPDLLVCNPPYVPEPSGVVLAAEAGAGADGSAHLRRVIWLAGRTQPRSLVLSWCSLCDPEGVVGEAEEAGYHLDDLFVVAIADGEYSGSVHDYLVTLPTAFLNDDSETIRAVAPDGAARFAYLLMAGSFSLSRSASNEGSGAVRELCTDFTKRGISALEEFRGAVETRCWLLDRWDEIALRAILHGPIRALLSGALRK